MEGERLEVGSVIGRGDECKGRRVGVDDEPSLEVGRGESDMLG